MRLHSRQQAQWHTLHRRHIESSKRIFEHRNHLVDGFTKRYKIEKLVWYEVHETMESAISREKQLKKWNRSWKIRLIESQNRHWEDLHQRIL